MQETFSNNIIQRSEEIYNLLAAAEIEQAIKRLMDFITDFSPSANHLHKAIAINRNYQQLIANKNTSSEVFKDQRKYLIHQIFDLLDQIETELMSSI